MNNQTKRKSKIFNLSESDSEQLKQPPESITEKETVVELDGYPHFKLEKLPLKGIKSIIVGMGIIVLAFFILQFYSLAVSALETHWILFSALIVFALFMGVQSIRILAQIFLGRRDLSKSASLKSKAETLNGRRDKDMSEAYKNDLIRFFEDKPQHPYLVKAIDSLPDYADDSETIAHFEKCFVSHLDQEAQSRISKYAAKSGVAVALSPWVSIDLLISLWRSLKLIDEIGQIYGIRPSLQTRYKLIRLVLEQLLLVGVTEWTMEQLVQDAGVHSIATFAGASITQGLGSGLYTCRIGLVAMECCRPMTFHSTTKPSIGSLMRPAFLDLAKLIKKPKSE